MSSQYEKLYTFVIYYSRPNKCWIAHSLHADQFGTGDCLVHALVDGLKAVDQVVALAKKDSDIKFNRAPARIWQIAKKAEKLPREVYEIAHKQAYGKWPNDLPFESNPPQHVSFKSEFCGASY